MQLSFFSRLKIFFTEHLALSFLLIFVAHLLFKSMYLDHSGFWYDETFGLYFSQQDWGLIKHTSEWDLNPPLYYYFLWIWRNLFGISEYAIRFSSVLFSSLAAASLFVFAMKFFNRTTALVALILFTASNEIYFYSHEARCYSIILFLAIWSSYFFLDLLNRRNMLSIILLGLINFLLIYTHYLTGLILLFQLVLLVIINQKQIYKRMIWAFGITIILAFWRFTWKTIYLIFHHEKSFWLEKPTLKDLGNTFFDFFNGATLFLLIALTVILMIVIFKTRGGKLSSEERIKTLYLVFCGLLTILVTYIASSFMPLFLKRYLLFAFPFLCAIVGFLVSILHRPLKIAMFGIITVYAVFMFAAIDLRTPKYMQYREAMPLIKEMKTPETAVLVQTKALNALFAYYYDQKIFKDFYHFDSLLRASNVFPVSGPEDLRDVNLKNYKRVILTQTFEQMAPHGSELPLLLAAQFRKKAIITQYQGLTIRIYQ